MQKLCECGCGLLAPIAKQTNKKIGHVKGQPIRFIKGHVKYNGGVSTHTKGYRCIALKGHPRTNCRGYVFEHILVIENYLGRYLLPEECVHHLDGNKTNNNLDNLLLCKDNAEHKAIHAKERAFKECGNENYRQCGICGKWDKPENLYIAPNNKNVKHRECWKKYYTDNSEHFNELQRIRRHTKNESLRGSAS